MAEVNLDAAKLISLLKDLADPRTLNGGFEVSSFGTVLPERRLRFVFEDGRLWVQHPLLWAESER